MPTISVKLRLSKKLLQRLDARVKETKRPRSAFIREALMQRLDDPDREQRIDYLARRLAALAWCAPQTKKKKIGPPEPKSPLDRNGPPRPVMTKAEELAQRALIDERNEREERERTRVYRVYR